VFWKGVLVVCERVCERVWMGQINLWIFPRCKQVIGCFFCVHKIEQVCIFNLISRETREIRGNLKIQKTKYHARTIR